jgi:hypothetical protein
MNSCLSMLYTLKQLYYQSLNISRKNPRQGVRVLNAIFNNISVISWWRVLFLEETRVLSENHRPDILYHNMLYRVSLTWTEFELTTSMVICIDCIGNNKSNYHTITTTTAQHWWLKCLHTGLLMSKCIKCKYNAIIYHGMTSVEMKWLSINEKMN